MTNSTKLYRQLISIHKDSYCEDTKYTPSKLVNAQQIALYECTKIQTACENNIEALFGIRLRTLLNKMFKKEEKLNNLNERMKSDGSTNEAIKKAHLEEIFHPCIQVKLDVAKKKLPSPDILDKKSRSYVRALLSIYPNDYKFQKDSIFYDVAARPTNHFKDFHKLAHFCELEKLKTFSCYPGKLHKF
ncbi:hypothetical protein EDC94DRAFT_321125 [Helicostylum pulchrum]|nr:hypothetical protein EDC94DRAFT_321125 [Helicostylum pulchrum]